MTKIWEVEFGNNFTKKIVKAKDVFEAIKTATRIADISTIPKKDCFVSKVEMIAETDD